MPGDDGIRPVPRVGPDLLGSLGILHPIVKARQCSLRSVGTGLGTMATALMHLTVLSVIVGALPLVRCGSTWLPLRCHPLCTARNHGRGAQAERDATDQGTHIQPVSTAHSAP